MAAAANMVSLCSSDLLFQAQLLSPIPADNTNKREVWVSIYYKTEILKQSGITNYYSFKINIHTYKMNFRTFTKVGFFLSG